MKQANLFHTILPCFVFLLFSLYWVDSFDHSEKFVQCLLERSDNSTAISKIIYTPSSPFFTRILETLIQNLRYGTPETPKPVVILTPTEESQIQAAIYCSKKVGLQIRIRSGGNDLEGSSYVSHVPFFILDMYMFQSISIDAETKTVWVGPGATNGELHYAINQTDSTLAFAGAYWPTVGVGGHICGGGSGGLVRKYGVSADNVIDARIIDVNGRILDRKSMGKDLFWAIRGGSCASFGVVTAFKLKLVRVPKVVAGFSVTRSIEQGAIPLIYKWQLAAPKVPKDLAIMLYLVNNLPSNSTKQTVLATFVSTFFGDVDTLVSLMDQHFPELCVSQSDCTTFTWIDSNMHHLGFPLQNKADFFLSRTPPEPVAYFKMKAGFYNRPIPKEELNKMLSLIMQVPPGAVFLECSSLGGIMDEIDESSIPFPHRKGNLILIGPRFTWSTPDAAITKLHLDVIRKLHKNLRHYAANNPRPAYANYRDHDLGTNNIHGPTSVEQARNTWGAPYYKGNFDRLVRVKTRVDPENYFNYEQSIPLLPSSRVRTKVDPENYFNYE